MRNLEPETGPDGERSRLRGEEEVEAGRDMLEAVEGA